MGDSLGKFALGRQAKFAHLLNRDRQNAAMGIKQKNPRAVLASNLKALMAHGDTNQSQLGKRADIAQSTIGRILREKHAPDLDTLHALGQAFGLTPWQLLVPNLDPSNPPALQTQSPEEMELYRKLREAAALLPHNKPQ